jgi:RNA polymerase sigma-70 factor (ECF subfamily)
MGNLMPAGPQDRDPVDWLSAARAGNQNAFEALTEPHRNELLSHCYRMLGSLQDAEDMVQETFLRAWRRLDTYQALASFRAWMYKIATNACLDQLKRRPKRTIPTNLSDPVSPDQMQPPRLEPIWLEPFPDELLAPREISPEGRYSLRESISLAFLVSIQALQPRQRSALLLADVLDWPIDEIAEIMGSSVSAVNSLLYRARQKLTRLYTGQEEDWIQTGHTNHEQAILLERYLNAWIRADVDGLVALLTEDATFPMPPIPSWCQGRDAIRSFVLAAILYGDPNGRWLILPTRSNAQPAYAWYRRDAASQKYHAFAVQVLTLRGSLISDVTTFGFPHLFPFFNLELELPA